MAQEPIERIDIEASADTAKAVSNLSALEKTLNRLNSIKGFKRMDTLASSLSNVEDSLTGSGKTASGLEKINKALDTTQKKASAASSKIAAATKAATDSTEKAEGRLTRVMNAVGRVLLHRVIFGGINRIISGTKQGLDNLYQYSAGISGMFAASMDRMATSAQYFQNSVGAALSPIINSLAPILDKIIDKIVEAINWINQFFAILGGQSTWTRAVKSQKKYAEATGGTTAAVKELRRTIMGFDELNLLNDAVSSGGGGSGGGGTDYGAMFEEVPIDEAYESAKKFAEFIGDIAERIGELARKVKEFIDPVAEAFGGWPNLLLAAAGAVGTFIAAMNGLKTVGKIADYLQLPPWIKTAAGVATGVIGLVLEWQGMYEIGKGNTSLENILKAGIGAGLAVAGFTYAFGPAGLALGLATVITLGITAFKLGQSEKIKEDVLNSEYGKYLQGLIDKGIAGQEYVASIKLKVDTAFESVTEIENKFTALHNLINKAFTLDEKENKTIAEMRELRTLVDAINSYGIVTIHMDEDGITETREEIENAYKGLEKFIKLQAYQDFIIQGLKSQALYEIEIANAQDDLNSSLRERDSILEKLADSPFGHITDEYGGTIDLSPADIAKQLTGWSGKMNSLFRPFQTKEVQELMVQFDLANKAVEENTKRVNDAKKAYNDAGEKIKYCYDKMSELSSLSPTELELIDTKITDAQKSLDDLKNSLSALKNVTGKVSVNDQRITEVKNNLQGFSDKLTALKDNIGTANINDKAITDSIAEAETLMSRISSLIETEGVTEIDSSQLTEALGLTGDLGGLLDVLADHVGYLAIDGNEVASGSDAVDKLGKQVAGLSGIKGGVTIDQTSLDSALTKAEQLAQKLGKPITQTVTVQETHSVSYSGQTAGLTNKVAPMLRASGGFPDTGEMFIAREAGPELVGTIGSRTAVANNGQIEAGIAAGVRDANGDVVAAIYAAAHQIISSEKDGGDIYLDGQKISRQVTAGQNRTNRMYGATLQNV